MYHPENDGSYTPTTRTECEVISRAETIARNAQRSHRVLGAICTALAESAKCDRNYIQLAQPQLDCHTKQN